MVRRSDFRAWRWSFSPDYTRVTWTELSTGERITLEVTGFDNGFRSWQ